MSTGKFSKNATYSLKNETIARIDEQHHRTKIQRALIVQQALELYFYLNDTTLENAIELIKLFYKSVREKKTMDFTTFINHVPD